MRIRFSSETELTHSGTKQGIPGNKTSRIRQEGQLAVKTAQTKVVSRHQDEWLCCAKVCPSEMKKQGGRCLQQPSSIRQWVATVAQQTLLRSLLWFELQKEFSINMKDGSTWVFPFCLFTHFTPELLPAAVYRLVVGINILSVVCEQISEQMEKLSFETVSGSFHGVECGGSKNGTFFSFLNNIHTYFCVWVLSFAAFGCFILGNIFQSQWY